MTPVTFSALQGKWSVWRSDNQKIEESLFESHVQPMLNICIQMQQRLDAVIPAVDAKKATYYPQGHEQYTLHTFYTDATQYINSYKEEVESAKNWQILIRGSLVFALIGAGLVSTCASANVFFAVGVGLLVFGSLLALYGYFVAPDEKCWNLPEELAYLQQVLSDYEACKAALQSSPERLTE